MKRFISILLAAIMLLSITACGSSQPVETTAAPTEIAVPETTVPETTTPETTVPETTVPVYEGDLFLTVSSINFSLVGESEDIYVGTAPREEIIWASADESVITVENGVLTAVGVGSTTVSATYGDQYMECTAGCLAQTQEDLYALGYDVIRQPKRMPPVYDDELITFFDDAAIVGDSISYIMYQWEATNNMLKDALFLVRGGCSINGFVRKYKLIYYQGVETCVEDALALAGVNKVFIMLGQNDLSYMTIEDTMANYATMVDRIREKSPDIEIYLQSCIPEWFKNGAGNEKNEKIDEFNVQLKAYCEENDVHFVDLAPYAEDHENKMPTPYSMDYGIHMNEVGCIEWMRVLRAYAKLQTLKGEE